MERPTIRVCGENDILNVILQLQSIDDKGFLHGTKLTF